jgi:Trk K+ transport system NAD-binding subunit
MRHRLVRSLFLALRFARARAVLLLALAAALVVVVGPPAFVHEARVDHLPLDWGEAVYDSLGLFTLQANRLGYPHGAVLRLLYFLAPLVSASALLGAFGRIVEERGALLLGELEGHAVVGGLGNLGTTLVRHQELTGQAVVGIERREDAPEVADLRAAGTVVLTGDETSTELLRRAGAHRAASVFFTAASDVANLDAAFQVRRLARGGNRPPPTVYAHVFDSALSDVLAGHLEAHEPREARIVPWNSYRFAAKSLVAHLVRDKLLARQRVAPGLWLCRTEWPNGDAAALSEPDAAGPALEEDRRRLLAALRLEGSRADAPVERLVVIGLGHFGRSVVRELLDVTSRAARFLIVERSGGSYRQGSEAFTDEERARFEVLLGDATSAASVDRIAAFQPTAVVICTDNDLSNLRLAILLRRRELRAVTRMFDLEAGAELGRGLDERGISIVGLSRLFRAAIPILTHERRLLACVNLDIARTPQVDHLFYLARVRPEGRARLGRACVPLEDLPHGEGAPPPPAGALRDLALVWYRAIAPLASLDDPSA